MTDWTRSEPGKVKRRDLRRVPSAGVVRWPSGRVHGRASRAGRARDTHGVRHDRPSRSRPGASRRRGSLTSVHGASRSGGPTVPGPPDVPPPPSRTRPGARGRAGGCRPSSRSSGPAGSASCHPVRCAVVASEPPPRNDPASPTGPPTGRSVDTSAKPSRADRSARLHDHPKRPARPLPSHDYATDRRLPSRKEIEKPRSDRPAKIIRYRGPYRT